jgi:hypothetical protein
MLGGNSWLEQKLRENGSQAQAEIRSAEKTTDAPASAQTPAEQLVDQLLNQPLTIARQLKAIRDLALQVGQGALEAGQSGSSTVLIGSVARGSSASAGANSSKERIAHLTRLADLHEQGALTDSEFEKMKHKILAG